MDRPEDRLALITLLDHHGRALRNIDVHAWPLTLGRGLDQQLVLDDASDTTAAVRAARKLMDEAQVDAILGPSSTPNSLALLDAARGILLQG